MSWGPISATDSADSIEAALTTSAAAYTQQLENDENYVLSPEAAAQIAGAISAAVSAVPVVAPDQSVTITINGHTNPGNAPDPGWANPYVQIVVTNAATA
jgi:hypothetical protein